MQGKSEEIRRWALGARNARAHSTHQYLESLGKCERGHIDWFFVTVKAYGPGKKYWAHEQRSTRRARVWKRQVVDSTPGMSQAYQEPYTGPPGVDPDRRGSRQPAALPCVERDLRIKTPSRMSCSRSRCTRVLGARNVHPEDPLSDVRRTPRPSFIYSAPSWRRRAARPRDESRDGRGLPAKRDAYDRYP